MRAMPFGVVFGLLLSASATTAEVIPPDGGEARLIAGRPLWIKVDPVTVGATHFMVGTELLEAGKAIPVHRHANMEEILFIHKGTVTVTQGETTSVGGPGTVVFVPTNTWIGVENHGTEPALILFVFPMVGMEGFFRRVAPRVGEPAVRLTPEEREAIFQQYKIFPKRP